jgi:predicted unusual protein kinase regulating ubiquinone biosynthesis (AarF/ABC1/UbiB family)
MEERMAMLQDPALLGDRLNDIVRVLSSAGFKLPPELTLFFRNVVYLGDAIQRHTPDLDFFSEVAPLVTSVLNQVEQ